MPTDKEIESANKRGEQMRREFPHAVSARYDRSSGKVMIELSSKLTLSFSPQDAQGLEGAKPSELDEIELSPLGFGVHFPKLDADLYIPGLMGSKKWMAARLGQLGGQSRSRAKKAASRANGKLGGRPRKRAHATG